MSKKFFIEHFFTWFVNLKNDKIMSIRRKFCFVSAQVMLNLFGLPKKSTSAIDEDKDHRFQLIDALDHLKNDLDEEVSEAAYDSEKQASNYKSLTDEEYHTRVNREKFLL
jgi:hypothetical protein